MNRTAFGLGLLCLLSGRCYAAPAFLTEGEELFSLNGSWDFKPKPSNFVLTPADVVVDNTDREQVQIAGPHWTASQWKGGGAFWGTNYLVAAKREKGVEASVTYQPKIPRAGTYEVFGMWSRGQRDISVKTTIKFQGGSKTVQVNQASAGNGWSSLGKFPFAAGAENSIKVDASGEGAQVVADAFLLRPTTSAPNEPEWYAENLKTANWDKMVVPGNWDTTNEYAHYKGEAWYRRQFSPPAEWKNSRVRLKFDAVYHDATVYLNGKPLGGHSGGYTPFEFDVTDSLRFDRPNVLAVKVDSSYNRGAWWPWGGISRSVQLVRNNEVRIEQQRIHTDPDLTDGTAEIFVAMTVRNSGTAAREVQLNSRLAFRTTPDQGLYTPTTVVKLAGGERQTVEWSTTLPANQVRLWDFDHPHLYICQTTASVGGRVQHSRQDRFGIRRILITKDQLLLNGQPIRMPGFNRVHDHRLWGNTEPEHLVRQDVDLMKRLGGNLMRIMHGAQAPNLLDYMDEKGMLVISEIPVWGGDDPLQREAGNPTTRRWLRELVERDFNHPCIIGWSVGNELTGHYNYVKSMVDYVRQDLDPHRLAGYVSNSGTWPGMGPTTDPITFSDLTMFNSYGSLKEAAGTLRQRWPNKPLFFTEYGANQIGVSLDSRIPRLEEQIESVRTALPYVVGVSLWTLNDYRSAFQGTGPSEDRSWGVVNSWRQPKRAFEQIARQFSPIRSLSLQGTDTIRLEPRNAVDFPSYILRDYQLKWELRRQNGTIADGGLISLPVIKPGDAALTYPIRWQAPAEPVADLILSLITPTGYVVHESREALSVPGKPEITTVLSGDKSTRVLFTPVVGAEEYKVFYSAAGEAPRQAGNRGTIDTQVTVSGLANGKTYQFTVVAVNGRGESVASNAVDATPAGKVLPPVIWKAVPMNGGFGVGFSTEGADRSVVIEYGTKDGQFTEKTGELTVKGATTVTGLHNGTTYYLHLKRQGEYGESGWSQTVSVTPNSQLPPVPTLLGGVRGDGQFSVRFAPSEQATSYRIRYEGTGSAPRTVDIEAATVEQAIVSGVDNSRPYAVSIAAIGAGGISQYSTPLTLTATAGK